MIVTQVLAAALGTVAFALLFGVPRVLSLLRPYRGSRLADVLSSGAGAECCGSYLFCFGAGDIPFPDGGCEGEMSGYHFSDIGNHTAGAGSRYLLVRVLYGDGSADRSRGGRLCRCRWRKPSINLELYVCSNCRRAFLISSAGTGKSFAHKRAGKTADAVESCSYSDLYEVDIRILNLCFPIRIFRPQLSVALMRLDKGEKFARL